MALLSFLDREHTIAPPGFNRWRVPPAALAIHLCIGQAYAFSVFNLPLSKLIGGTESAPGDWKLSTIGWVFSIAIVFLGLSAAVFGRWLEYVGPRRAMFASACCFSGGFLVGALGIATHQFWLLILGYGVLGGIGLGLGYISPVSTLMKWFPDRPGMATGMAIMGFGGGAMLASPLAVRLMDFYRTPTAPGVWQTFVTMGLLYFCYMMLGVFTVRVPADGWKPAGWVRKPSSSMVTHANVTVNVAMRTPQFWLLWVVLCVNITAGIGVLAQASPMIQEMFGERISVSAAAGFVALLSLANMAGRFAWSSMSDLLGRKRTYFIFFTAGSLLYAAIPSLGHAQNVVLFVVAFVLILTMYGGGFATIPAYLKDMFGTMHVGAIHGRLLTAWSTAGVLGPVLVNYIREYQLEHGAAKSEAYSVTMYVMVGLLLLGFVANLLVRPVHERHHHVESPGPDSPIPSGVARQIDAVLDTTTAPVLAGAGARTDD
ncbi:MAG TPA: OFA family MFS transporter [Gemmatimonadaceae bacterium]|nr:OFA family MFS transporter [Gemmatimonadaceae bacterium]